MTNRPNYAEAVHAVYRGENPHRVIWQPRIDYWYLVNKKRGTLPPPLQDASLLDVYDYCHASCRYFLWGDAWLNVRRHNVEIISESPDADRVHRTWHTPVGDLHETLHYDEWAISAHHTEYRLKTPDDFRILRYILEDEEWYWDDALFQQHMATFGAYSAPIFYYRRSPVQRLFIEDMGFQNTIYFINDYPELVDEYIAFATAADDPMYALIEQCPVKLLNLGENIDGFLDSPRYWTKYLVPYYNKRIDQLHAAGKRVSIHIDGVMRPLLPHLHDCPFDSIEAATPVPQGDVTLEEIKDAMGDTILVDGIPALHFLAREYSVDELMACAQRVVDLFYPHLILGISDEIPPDGDIERVRLIGEWCESLSV